MVLSVWWYLCGGVCVAVSMWGVCVVLSMPLQSSSTCFSHVHVFTFLCNLMHALLALLSLISTLLTNNPSKCIALISVIKQINVVDLFVHTTYHHFNHISCLCQMYSFHN